MKGEAVPDDGHELVGKVAGDGSAGEVARVECAHEKIDGHVEVWRGRDLSGSDGASKNFAQHLAPRGDDAFAKEANQLGIVGFFGQDGADERHAVGAEERTAKIFKGLDEVGAMGCSGYGRFLELEGTNGGGG